MIAYFPEIYQDELLYSWFSRFYVKSGYMVYRYCAEELYVNRAVRPDIEFVNELNTTIIERITTVKSMAAVVLEHTMFPYYGRFLPIDRRKKAFEALVSTKGKYYNLLPLPKKKTTEDRYLRYCPVCAENDRKQYGETYWHREHQLIGVNICPSHCCQLLNSSVKISGEESPSLMAADSMIPESNNVIYSKNEIEMQTAKYIAGVFHAPISLGLNVSVGAFLHSKMEGTEYLSLRGEQRNISLFHADFTEYYKDLKSNWFTELWQIQKVLTNDRYNSYEICLLAMFLQIPVEELVQMKVTEKSQNQKFDEQIFGLHEQGLSYAEIARRLGASYHVVKSIGKKRYGTYHKKPKKPIKSGAKVRDWEQIDNDILPLVKDAIRKIYGDGINRPKKVTVFGVEQLLNLPSKQITLYLPKCKAEIEKYHETQEQYWIREIIWAINEIRREGKTLNWKSIRTLTNLRKSNVRSCIPYMTKFTDVENIIKEIL